MAPVLNQIQLLTNSEQKVGGFVVFNPYGRTWSGTTVFPGYTGDEYAMVEIWRSSA